MNTTARRYDPTRSDAGLPKECVGCGEPAEPTQLNGQTVVACPACLRAAGAR